MNVSRMNLNNGDVQRLTNYLFKDPTITLLNFEYSIGGPAELKMIAEAIRRSSTITSLNVGRNKVGDEGMKILAEALQVNTSLTHLDVANINMGVEGLQVLADLLRRSDCSLASLHVGDKDIEIGSEGGKILMEALFENTSITSLNFHSASLGEEGMWKLRDLLQAKSSIASLHLGDLSYCDYNEPFALADILRDNTSITTLALEYLYISTKGVQALMAALLRNTFITSLKASWVDDEGERTKMLADVIRGSTLTSLNISNYLGDAGAVYLAEALRANTSITSLTLEHNYLFTSGKRALIEAFQVNSTITSLRFRPRILHSSEAKALGRVLQSTSCSLTCLCLGYIDSDEARKHIAEGLSSNKTLTQLHFSMEEAKPKKEIMHLVGRNYSLIKCNIKVPGMLYRNQVLERKKSDKEDDVGWHFMENGEFIRLGSKTEFPFSAPSILRSWVKKIVLQGCNLTCIPPAIFGLPSLATLDLG